MRFFIFSAFCFFLTSGVLAAIPAQQRQSNNLSSSLQITHHATLLERIAPLFIKERVAYLSHTPAAHNSKPWEYFIVAFLAFISLFSGVFIAILPYGLSGFPAGTTAFGIILGAASLILMILYIVKGIKSFRKKRQDRRSTRQ